MQFDCVFDVWSPKIGDPHIMGWATVGAYFVAALLALLVSLRVKDIFPYSHKSRGWVFWLLLVLLMVFLGVNKQLDLQSYFTAIGKCYAKLGGWYEDRRQIQFLFILSFGGLFFVVGTFILWLFRKSVAHSFWAIMGVSVLMVFTLMRAASFHHFDLFINHEVAGVRMNWVMELSGIFLICVQAILDLRNKKPR